MRLTEEREREIREVAKHVSDRSVIPELLAEIDALKAELATSRRLVKEICEEWNEDCDAKCDSWAHTETCKSVSIAEAKKALNTENQQLRTSLQSARNDAIEECAKEADAWQRFWSEKELKTVPAISPAHIADCIRALKNIEESVGEREMKGIPVMERYCCRLDQEFICGVVRNRSGIDSGELDFAIRIHLTEGDLERVIQEVERMLENLKNRRTEE